MDSAIYVKSKGMIKKNAKEMRDQVVPTFKQAIIEIIKADVDQKTKEDEANRVIDKLINFLGYSDELAETFNK